MAADVVGYSRLIRADEEGTIAALKALRADLIDPKLAEHNGRIVKLMGDGMLAEFQSVVDAVRAAAETQRAVAGASAAAGGKAGGANVANVFDRPAVAVLPFDNMSGDPEQDYFCDGVTEDIITALSAWRSFPVLAGNSTSAYKGQSPDVRTVARELGVRYVIEGSIRKSGNRVRVTAQLIDAETGHHVWADRFDREIGDIFALQDEITEHLAANIEPELERSEERRLVLRRPTDLTVWEHILHANRAKASGGHGYGTKELNAEARGHLRQALALDPNSSEALALLAQCEWHDAIQGWADDTKEGLTRGFETARRAVTEDDGNWLAHSILGLAYLFRSGEADAAVEQTERAVQLNPSAALACHCHGCTLEFKGLMREAIPHLQAVFRLDPRYRSSAAVLGDLALCYLLLGNDEEAIDWAGKAVTTHPDYVRGRQRLVAALGVAGRGEEAEKALAELLKLQPDFSIDYVRSTYPFKNPQHLDILIGGLLAAGLPA